MTAATQKFAGVQERVAESDVPQDIHAPVVLGGGRVVNHDFAWIRCAAISGS